jgi:phosphoglycerol transferase MdoB-like AlkP superfamily enzyme
VSSTRGSIYSLESILSNSTGWPLFSNSTKRFVQQESSVALPFKNAGYETIFVTAGKVNWRNINELLPNLYFDRLIGSSVICKDFPEAVEKTWGVADEFLYKEIMKLLDEKNSKPKLICAFTTINHTPYEIPSDYVGFPINIPDSLYKIIIANKEIAQLVFKSYQYSCNSLGEFMTALKSSSHSDSTIVGATGDHNSYTLFPFESDQNQPLDKHGVPFFLYMPEIYKQNKDVDINRAGSHKDIFPTIICNVLSGQRYFCSGDNLLEKVDSSHIYFGDNGNYIYALPETPNEKVEKRSTARRQLLEYYFSDYYLKNKVNQTVNSKEGF